MASEGALPTALNRSRSIPFPGVVTWVSPEQPNYIKMLTTLPEMQIAVTEDIDQTIKLWDCHNRDALVTNKLLFPCQTVKAVFTKYSPIVLAGGTESDLSIFRIPDLHLISKVHVFQYGIEELYCSPQKKWVFLSKKHPHILPKVRHLVASFEFQDIEDSLEWMGVSDKNVIVCSTLSSLLLFSMEGCHLQRFQYYPEEILSLWVDPVYVIVTFIDGSLEVYTWEERSLLLRRCYRLTNRRHLTWQ
ncbi:F-box/WD repeat-containing protein 15-like, partial [Grammomys surdaster]|uniref:F-box/WD repeat-containing protein 15-like n=1 Tax=Grammomys surdaster TaxID=491861 RepID=UPI00109F52B0